MLPIPTSSNVEQLSYTQLKSDIAAGQVASVSLGPDGSVSGQLTNGTKSTSGYPVGLQDPQFAQLLDQHNVQVHTQPAQTSTWSILLSLLPLAIIVALFVWSGRATRRQLASFVEMFVGVGAARVRDLFVDARRLAPSIVFVDEIDAIGQRRGRALISNDERDQTLNQLLAEMDWFDPTTGVVVIAATNRPEVLDPALLRPGRFDRQVVIPLPNQQERKAILAIHSRGKSLGPDVDLQVVARGTPGFSGTDLANLVNEAAIFAVRAGRQVIKAEDLAEARDRVLLGRRDSSNALLPQEKHAVAVHESGHALAAALSEHGDPVAKMTILPTGQALGVTEQLASTSATCTPRAN